MSNTAALEVPTTNIAGYFNPHDYPVQVELSSHNFVVLLSHKGQFLTVNGVKGGVRINDPILEKYCGQHGLAKAMSAEPVPIVFLPNRGAPKSLSPAGFVGVPGQNTAESLPAALVAQTKQQLQTQRVPVPASSNSSSVRAMAYTDAVKLGYIKPTKVIDEGVPATSEVSADRIPMLDVAIDTPRGQRALTAPVIDDVGPIAAASPEEAALIESRTGLKASAKALPVIVANPIGMPNAPKPKVLPFKTPELKPPTLDDEPEPTGIIVQDEVELDEHLPDPEASTLGAPTLPPQPVATPKFTCSVDGRSFMHRATLQRYAKDKYPDRVDEIMAAYPKK